MHCPSAQPGGYSANWRVLSKVGDIVFFAGPTIPSIDHFHGEGCRVTLLCSDGTCSYISHVNK